MEFLLFIFGKVNLALVYVFSSEASRLIIVATMSIGFTVFVVRLIEKFVTSKENALQKMRTKKSELLVRYLLGFDKKNSKELLKEFKNKINDACY